MTEHYYVGWIQSAARFLVSVVREAGGTLIEEEYWEAEMDHAAEQWAPILEALGRVRTRQLWEQAIQEARHVSDSGYPTYGL